MSHYLPIDVMIEIATPLSYKDTMAYCRLNRERREICNIPGFWTMKAMNKYKVPYNIISKTVNGPKSYLELERHVDRFLDKELFAEDEEVYPGVPKHDPKKLAYNIVVRRGQNPRTFPNVNIPSVIRHEMKRRGTSLALSYFMDRGDLENVAIMLDNYTLTPHTRKWLIDVLGGLYHSINKEYMIDLFFAKSWDKMSDEDKRGGFLSAIRSGDLFLVQEMLLPRRPNKYLKVPLPPLIKLDEELYQEALDLVGIRDNLTPHQIKNMKQFLSDMYNEK